MVEIVLVAAPAAFGVLCLFLSRRSVTRFLLVAGALTHTALTVWAWIVAGQGGAAPSGPWLGIDSLGLLFLSVTSLLFLAASFYAAGFLAREGGGEQADPEEGFVFRNYPQGVFAGCLLLFLSSMTLVTLSRHFGLLWVAVEATTLATASLIHYHRHHRSLEAAWKYLLVCSVGIALALLGNFLLAASAAGAEGSGLSFDSLRAHASALDQRWLKAAALLMIVGYGTKMGLVPMHTWLPDAHSEAPSAVSALLSGAALNCAFLAILRLQGVMGAAGLGDFGREVLLVLGFVSMAGAALFIVAQKDYKRLLAYSSVENMGILAVGVGLGGGAEWGALYHAVNHSLVKAALFFTAGNILLAYQSKRVEDVRGMLRNIPLSGFLWMAGFVAVAGFPPFGSFLSELAILRSAVSSGRYLAAALFLLFLTAAFVGLTLAFPRMALGEAGRLPASGGSEKPALPLREGAIAVLPPLLLLLAAGALGIVVPAFLDTLISAATPLLGGSP